MSHGTFRFKNPAGTDTIAIAGAVYAITDEGDHRELLILRHGEHRWLNSTEDLATLHCKWMDALEGKR